MLCIVMLSEMPRAVSPLFSFLSFSGLRAGVTHVHKIGSGQRQCSMEGEVDSRSRR